MTTQPRWLDLPSPLLVIGPAHSGKSQFALGMLDAAPDTTVIGTADPDEPAFRNRLDHLRSLRPRHWSHIDVVPAEAYGLPESLGKALGASGQILVDSVNQWVASMLVTDMGRYNIPQMDQRLDAIFYTLIETLMRPRAGDPRRIVFVASETGAGTVPPGAVERLFRQSNGRINCQLAEVCASVVSMTAGIPVVIKS